MPFVETLSSLSQHSPSQIAKRPAPSLSTATCVSSTLGLQPFTSAQPYRASFCKYSDMSQNTRITNTFANEDKTTRDAPTARTGLALCSRCHPARASEGTLVGPGKDTHGLPTEWEGRGWPETSSTGHHHNDKTKVTVTRLGYQHGSGAGLLKPQVHEATTELGDNVEEMIVSDRIVDPLHVFVTSEYGWSANVERSMKAQALRDNSTNLYMMSKKTVKVNPTHSVMTELKENWRTSLTRYEGFDKQRSWRLLTLSQRNVFRNESWKRS